MEHVSRQLFSYLCQVIGSEQVVRSRRIFFYIMDDMFGIRELFSFISSGSKGEGLNMTGSDLDVMFVAKEVQICHDNSEPKKRPWLITDSESAPPGFVYLKDLFAKNDNMFVTFSEYGPVLSSEKFIASFLHHVNTYSGLLMNIHGPCVTENDEQVDHAFCLKSNTWPKIAAKWFNRPRHSGWPSVKVEDMCVIHGLLYVPIGSKFNSKNRNPLQWRISFSIQEKLLVCSFNHTQLLCYALLKLVLKEHINTKTHVSNLLCSYFMKTTVFWMCEEIHLSEWRAEKLFKCFSCCIKRLIYWVKLAYCPNYFIPENNMFAGKIQDSKQNELLSVLENINGIDIHSLISELPTLTNFIQSENNLQMYIKPNDIDVGIYPLLCMYLKFLAPGLNPALFIPFLLSRIRNRRSHLFKSLHFQWLAHLCIHQLTDIPYDWQCKNKFFYRQYKQVRFYALIGKNIDTVSGWLFFASFLYQNQHYVDALAIMSLIQPECTPDKYYITSSGSQEMDYNIMSPANFTFLERHKTCCIYQLNSLQWYSGSVFDNTDLGMSEPQPNIVAPPVVYLHFLKFMCYHHLGNISERNKCISDIELTIENDFFVGFNDHRVCSYAYLLKTLQITNSFSRFRDILKKLVSLLRQTDVPRSVLSYWHSLELLSDLVPPNIL